MVLAYLSGPIIHSQLRKDNFYKLVIDILRSMEVEVFAPQFLPAAEPDEVFQRDVREVRRSDLLITEVSNPSLGVGMEIMLAFELSKPILMFWQTESKPLSFMAKGAPGKALFEYTDLDEVESILRGINITNLRVGHCNECLSGVAEVRESRLKCVKCGQTSEELSRG
ncbi:MAG: nucleoside 2-deoxyribosyltransferase [Candidatus Thorarchaeota archaeon]|nr:MAG: nucleoside 2-deoxyribosyltransferase [Candidatus Thorarchaeota archaeon]